MKLKPRAVEKLRWGGRARIPDDLSRSAWRMPALPQDPARWRTQGGTENRITILSTMKQPTSQEERNEDKKKPEKENPSHGIDPESKEPEMEAEKEIGE